MNLTLRHAQLKKTISYTFGGQITVRIVGVEKMFFGELTYKMYAYPIMGYIKMMLSRNALTVDSVTSLYDVTASKTS